MKPYAEYKESGIEWIGGIPSHWEQSKISWCFSTIGSGTTPKSDNAEYYDNGFIDWVITGDLNDGVLAKTSKKITQKAVDECSALKLFPKGTLLVAMYGATIGKIAVMDFDGYTNQACCAIANSQKVLTKIAYYWFLANKQNIINMSYGGGQPNINQDIVKALKIVFPSLDEQQSIADFLDDKTAKIDVLIDIKRKQIELLKEQRTAVINQAVTQGLDPNAEMKDSGIEWLGDIPKHWEVKRLRYVFGLNTGLSITKEDLQENGVLIVNYGDIHTKYGFGLDLSRDELKCVDEKYIVSKKSALAVENDFVFCDTSEDIEGSGNCVYIRKTNGSQILAGSHTIIAKPIIEVKSRYLAYLFGASSWRTQIRSKVYGTKVYSISQKILKDVVSLLPPLFEQQQISDYLDKETIKIDDSISKAKKQIGLLTEYRTGLVSEAVTGKIDVREAI